MDTAGPSWKLKSSVFKGTSLLADGVPSGPLQLRSVSIKEIHKEPLLGKTEIRISYNLVFFPSIW